MGGANPAANKEKFPGVPTGTCYEEVKVGKDGEYEYGIESMGQAKLENGEEYYCIVNGLDERGVEFDKNDLFLDAAGSEGSLCYNTSDLVRTSKIFHKDFDVIEKCLDGDEERIEHFRKFFEGYSPPGSYEDAVLETEQSEKEKESRRSCSQNPDECDKILNKKIEECEDGLKLNFFDWLGHKIGKLFSWL